MKRLFVMAGVAVALLGAGGASAGLFAQGGGLTTPKCPGGALTSQAQISQDACQQAYDIYQLLSPQLGLALAGGNATAGQGSVLGGIGHISVGVRANVFDGLIPDVDKYPTPNPTGAVQRTLPTSSQWLGLPTADAAVGLFKGFPLALTNILGVDALVSAAYIPTVNQNNVSITPNNNWQFGWGARVGLLSESIVVPGVSFTWIDRDLPTTDITGQTNDQSTQFEITNLKVKTNAWRIVASKSLVMFGIAVGGGQDKYTSSADSIAATINTTVLNTPITGRGMVPDTKQDLTRTNIFLDLSFNLPVFKLVGEVGQASGGTVDTYNSFAGGRADRSQAYGSLGIRLSW
ncbi:MAG TPA: hypothetical protein VGM50_17930 [Gemmatimonadaceae bacterium]|jgi:hypothetical protein